MLTNNYNPYLLVHYEYSLRFIAFSSLRRIARAVSSVAARRRPSTDTPVAIVTRADSCRWILLIVVNCIPVSPGELFTVS